MNWLLIVNLATFTAIIVASVILMTAIQSLVVAITALIAAQKSATDKIAALEAQVSALSTAGDVTQLPALTAEVQSAADALSAASAVAPAPAPSA